MKGREIKKGKLLNAYEYILLIMAVIASGTPINSMYYTETVIYFFLASFIYFITVKFKTKFIIKQKLFFIWFSLVGLIAITGLYNADPDIGYYMGLILLITSSYLTVESMEYRVFSEKIVNIFLCIAAYSIILTLFFNIFKGTTASLPLLYTKDSTLASWKNFHYIYYIWDIYARFSIIRNSACFREPGVWGSFVSIVLVIKLSQMKKGDNRSKKDYIQLVILLVGAVTSLSTTTWLCLMIFLIIYYTNSKHTPKQYLYFAVFMIIGSVLIFKFQDLIFAKLSVKNTSYISTLERLQGVPGSIQSWMSSPIIGAGYTNYFTYVTEGSNTFSFLFVLGEFGILLFTLFFYMICKWIKKQKFTFVAQIALFLEIVLILNTQNLIFMPLILLIMFYGIRKEKLAI